MSGKYSETKKKGKKLWIFIILLILIVALVFIGIRIIKDKNKPKETIDIAFTAIKEANIEESKKYIDYQKLISILDDEMLSEEELKKVGLDKELFKELNWNIENIKIQKNQAIAIVEVTNKDYKDIITKWLKKIIQEQSNGNQLTDELCLEKLKECVADNEVATKTIIKKISLKKENDNWQIVVNDDLGNALFPRIESINRVLSEMK